MKFASFALVIAIAAAVSAWSDAHADLRTGGEKRGRTIDFEDEVVEGINRQPLDSVSQVSEKERRRKQMHLYRKRKSFRDESKQTLAELRYFR
ncbi:MAG: hypothetical protein AAB425_07075, partial [Bdellovibrionota bacterium]